MLGDSSVPQHWPIPICGVLLGNMYRYGFSVRVFAFYWVIWDKLGDGMAWMPQPSHVYDQKLIQNVLINPKGGTTRYIFLEQNKPVAFL